MDTPSGQREVWTIHTVNTDGKRVELLFNWPPELISQINRTIAEREAAKAKRAEEVQ